jgi:hypothetical protein
MACCHNNLKENFIGSRTKNSLYTKVFYKKQADEKVSREGFALPPKCITFASNNEGNPCNIKYFHLTNCKPPLPSPLQKALATVC